jgi:uncharacterized protein (TIGR02145 family)
MKKLASLHLLAFIFLTACAGSKGGGNTQVECSEYNPETHFCDTRDGKTYKYVKIGEQVWMAENANYSNKTFLGEIGQCYSNYDNYCTKYGRLYTYNTARRSVCPTGWHLPSVDEWQTLVKYIDPTFVPRTTNEAGTKLKATSSWNTDNGYIAGTDDYGFAALPGGQRPVAVDGGNLSGLSGSFSDIGMHGWWWSSSELGINPPTPQIVESALNSSDPLIRETTKSAVGTGRDLASIGFAFTLRYDNSGAFIADPHTGSLFSVRCVKD